MLKKAEQTENSVRKRGKTVKHQYSGERKVQFRKQRKIITEKRGRKGVKKVKIKIKKKSEKIEKERKCNDRSGISVLIKNIKKNEQQ